MGTVTNDLTDRARTIFADLGYEVEARLGSAFCAERGWKTVRVISVDETVRIPEEAGSFHCFVVDPTQADDLERRLTRADPEYEWAIMVIHGDDYAIERAPAPSR